jgi:hypothetical protein
MERDLSGRNALIADEFYYLGHKAIPVPGALRDVVPQTQGHRRIRDRAVVEAFVSWVRRRPAGRSGVPWGHRDRAKEGAILAGPQNNEMHLTSARRTLGGARR